MESLGVHALDARVMSTRRMQDLRPVLSTSQQSTTLRTWFSLTANQPHRHGTSCLLFWVSLFGIHSQIPSNSTTTSTPNEPREKAAMRSSRCFIITPSPRVSCDDQNKNGHLLRYLLVLVDSGRLKRANLYFLVKGHTKNHCDGGFGLVKRAYAKRDIYTMSQVTDFVEASATTNKAICVEYQQGVFKDWKALQTVYRDVKGIQKFQLFSIESSSPGVVMCRKSPSSEPLCQDLIKRGCVPTSPEGWETVWSSIEQLQAPIANPEKVSDLHKKILPFIPEEFRSDPLYRSPTPDEVKAANPRNADVFRVLQHWLTEWLRLRSNAAACRDEQKTGV